MSIIQVSQINVETLNIAGGTLNMPGSIIAGSHANIAGSLAVTGVANVTGDMKVTGNLYSANVSGDMKVTGNIYSGQVNNQAVSMGYISWAYLTGNSTLTWTGLEPAKQIKMKIRRAQPGISGAKIRIYLSSDNGVTYGPANILGIAAPQANGSHMDIIISNTAISGANKRFITYASVAGMESGTEGGYSMINVDSTMTSVVNAVKANSTSGTITFTTGSHGVGGALIYGEV